MLLKDQANRYTHWDGGKSPASFAIGIEKDSQDRRELKLEDWEEFCNFMGSVCHGNEACAIHAGSLTSSHVGKELIYLLQ